MLASGLSSDKGSSRRPVGVEFVFEESSHSRCFVARIDSFCTCVESLYSILDSFHSRCLSSLGCLGFFGFVVVLIRLYSPVEVESVFEESSPTFCFLSRSVSFCFCVETLCSVLDRFHFRCLSSLGCPSFFVLLSCPIDVSSLGSLAFALHFVRLK